MVRRIVTENSRSYPIWLELWEGRVQLGDPVERVTTRFKPEVVSRSGRFARLHYGPPGGESGTPLSLVARDGQLMSAHAGDCIWGHMFFNGMTESDWQELTAVEKAQRQAEGR